MIVRVTALGPQVQGKVFDHLRLTMEKAASYVEAKMKELVSVDYPPASAEYKPPRRRTGRFHDAISHRVSPDGRTAEIGVLADADCPYALWLEVGTSRMAPRPWASVTLHLYREEIASIVGMPIGTGVFQYHPQEPASD